MEGDVAKKRTRPDVSDRRKANKNLDEYVIKTSLSGKLCNTQEIRERINDLILNTSKIINLGSLVFNRLLLHYLNEGIELPDFNQTLYDQCFTIGTKTINETSWNKKNPILLKLWNDIFKEKFEDKVSRIQGDGQIISYAAHITYKTNFENSLKYTFFSRQKKFIYQNMKRLEIGKEHYHSIFSAINNFTCRKEPPKKALEFINQQKELLKPPDKGIDYTWIDKNRKTVVKYFFEMLRFMNTYEDAPQYNIVPINTIKNHFITIDKTILYDMLNNLKLTKMDKETFIGDYETQFNSVFNYNRLTKRKFSGLVQTDGVSICFHFKRDKKELKKKENTISIDTHRVIGIDPGRINLVYGAEKLKDGTIRKYKLTRKEYYHKAGMTKQNKRVKNWMKNIEAEERIFSKISTKTVSLQQWDNHLSDYVSVYDKLWSGKTGKKWGQSRFRVYSQKRKTLDNFFQTMNNSNKLPVIAFGAAKFNPNAKNEISAPTCTISKRCKTHFKTVMVDEFYTSQVCCDCNSKLSPINKIVDGCVRQVRGLRHCSSVNCSGVSFKDRDLVGALNIRRCVCEKTRPNCLSRNSCDMTKPFGFVIRKKTPDKVSNTSL